LSEWPLKVVLDNLKKIIHDIYDRSVALELPRNVSSCCCFHVVQNVAIEASLYAT